MILGFGDADYRDKDIFKQALITFLEQEISVLDFNTTDYFVIRKLLDKFNNDYPVWVDNKTQNKHKRCSAIFFEFAKDFNVIIMICHGHFWAYRNDFFGSPDGFAGLQIPFVVSVIFRDELDGERYSDSKRLRVIFD